jgi:SNF2 family DNA or RNA helicase
MQMEYMNHAAPIVLVGTIDAWGVGLNLQDTDILHIVMLPWSPRGVIQAEGRVSRQGQTRPVQIVYWIADGTVDDRVASVLLDKLPVVEQLFDESELAGLNLELRGGTDEELLAQLAEGYLEQSKPIGEQGEIG